MECGFLATLGNDLPVALIAVFVVVMLNVVAVVLLVSTTALPAIVGILIVVAATAVMLRVLPYGPGGAAAVGTTIAFVVIMVAYAGAVGLLSQ